MMISEFLKNANACIGWVHVTNSGGYQVTSYIVPLVFSNLDYDEVFLHCIL